MPQPNDVQAETIERERQHLVEHFKVFPFFKLMGIALVEIEPGRAKLSMGWRPDLVQPAGILHGGAIASLVDTAIAHSILLTPSFLESKAKGGLLVSVDLRVKYFRPVSSGLVYCEARVTRTGRQIVHTAATVTDAEGKEVAMGDSIYMVVSVDQLKRRNA